MKPLNIAIIDDQILFRQGLVQILRESDDYKVILETGSGQELFSRINGLMPDVILMDIHMTRLDGKVVSETLLKTYPQVKIIVLSMDYSPELILEMTRLGVHGYLSKEIDQALLWDAIQQVTTKGYYTNDEITRVLRQGLQASPAGKASHKKAIRDLLTVQLTKRELDVVRLICDGLNTSQIAEKLFISYRTVEGHRKNLLEKTGATNSVRLALFAVRHNLVGGVGADSQSAD